MKEIKAAFLLLIASALGATSCAQNQVGSNRAPSNNNDTEMVKSATWDTGTKASEGEETRADKFWDADSPNSYPNDPNETPTPSR